MSNPSRHDKWELLSGTGGIYFNSQCLYPHINRYQCDIRLLQDESPLVKDTKCILALGEEAQQKLANVTTTINEQRGSPCLSKNGIPIISSYLPQEAVDIKNYEELYNEALVASSPTEHSEDDSDEADPQDDKRRHGKTSKKHWPFWLQRDTEKAIKIIQHGSIPTDGFTPVYHIWPDSSTVINLLSSVKNQNLYFDIETDASINMLCFAFSFGFPDIYIVPMVDWNYQWAYSSLPQIIRALSIGIRDNCLVAHNGAGFDLVVLARKYSIPMGHKYYDTMLAMNRIYPETEKSLGHCISLPWMFEPFHKDDSNFVYRTEDQCRQLWLYCGKDVSSLIRLKKAQDDYATSHNGIRHSIDSVNSYVRPYLTSTLLGIRYKQELLEEVMSENDKLMNQYLRLLELLIGKDWLKKIRGSGKSSMPGSNKQCVYYFHTLLGFPPVGYTDTGNPSLGKKYLFKLKLKHPDMVVIDVIIAYRRVAKESGSLKFTPRKCIDNI